MTETFNDSVLSAIWFGPPLPPCFFLVFDLLEIPSVLQHFAARSALECDHTQQESFLGDHPAVPDLSYSPAAQDIFVSFLICWFVDDTSEPGSSSVRCS